jgi:hypothetical protein
MLSKFAVLFQLQGDEWRAIHNLHVLLLQLFEELDAIPADERHAG